MLNNEAGNSALTFNDWFQTRAAVHQVECLIVVPKAIYKHALKQSISVKIN